MNFSALMKVDTLAAILAYQIARQVRLSPTITGPYPQLPSATAVLFNVNLLDPDLRDILAARANQQPGTYNLGQIDVLACNVGVRGDYDPSIEPPAAQRNSRRDVFEYIAPSFSAPVQGSLDTFGLRMGSGSARNGLRILLSLLIRAYATTSPSVSSQFELDLDVDVFPVNSRANVFGVPTPGVTLGLRMGNLVIRSVASGRSFNIYQQAQREIAENATVVLARVAGQTPPAGTPTILPTVWQGAYNSIVSPITQSLSSMSVFAPGGLGRELQNVVSSIAGSDALTILNVGARIAETFDGDSALQIYVQMAEGRIVPARPSTDASVPDPSVYLLRMQLEQQTRTFWESFFTRSRPVEAAQAIGLFVSRSLVPFLLLAELGKVIPDFLSELALAYRRAAHSVAVSAMFDQETVNDSLRDQARSRLNHWFRSGACSAHDVLARSEPGRSSPASSYALIYLANTIRNKTQDALTDEDRLVLSILDTACDAIDQVVASNMEMYGISHVQATRMFEHEFLRYVTAAFQPNGTAMPPSVFEVDEARAMLEPLDRGCLIRDRAILTEVLRVRNIRQATRAVDDRFDEARRIVAGLQPPSPGMSSEAARAIVETLDAHCPTYSVFASAFRGVLGSFPTLGIEYERQMRQVAEGLPGMQLNLPHISNLQALFVGRPEDFSVRLVEAPTVAWHDRGPTVNVRLFANIPIGPLGGALRALLTFSGGDIVRTNIDFVTKVSVSTANRVGQRHRVSIVVEPDVNILTGILPVLGRSPLLLLVSAILWSESLRATVLRESLGEGVDEFRAKLIGELRKIFPESTTILFWQDGSGKVRLDIEGFAEGLFGPDSSLGPKLMAPNLLESPMDAEFRFIGENLAFLFTPFRSALVSRALGNTQSAVSVENAQILWGFNRACSDIVADFGLVVRISLFVEGVLPVTLINLSVFGAGAPLLNPAIQLEEVSLDPSIERLDSNSASVFPLQFTPKGFGTVQFKLFIPLRAIEFGYSAVVGRLGQIFLLSTFYIPPVSAGAFPRFASQNQIDALFEDCTRNR